MVYQNGRIPVTALTTIQPGVQLLNSAAAGFRLWQRLSALEGVKLTVATPVYGSGYRDIATQVVYWKASQGDRAAMEKAGLNSASAVRVAAPGGSVHGFGDRLDVVWGGSAAPTHDQLELAARCGWDREFGSADPNHLAHDGRTHTASEADRNRIVCRWLNGRQLGRTSNTDQDGTWPADSNFSWMVQEQGHRDGLYPTPPYEKDGIRGPRTIWLRDHYFIRLWNA